MTEKENHLPNLSSEERAHALELAIQAFMVSVRLSRRDWKESLSSLQRN